VRELEGTERRFSRGRLLWGGAAAAAGAAAIGSGRRDGVSGAAASRTTDVEILNLFLTLEHVQATFYRQAVDAGGLDGELLELAQRVGAQEREHVAFLTKLLGDRAGASPKSDFKDAVGSPKRFRDTAIELEEAAIAAYIGEGGNLSTKAVHRVVTLISVEARQVAWLRDLAGISPAPRAADASRRPDAVLADLRKKGFLQ
jgi:hypothetical protein